MLTFMLTHNYSMLHVEDLINAPLGLLPPMTSSSNKASQASSHGSYLFYEAIFANAAITCAGHRDKGLGSRYESGGLAREESFNMISSTRFRLCFAC